MKVYIIIMQSTIGNEKTRLCSTQCYGGTFVSEKSANTFVEEHREDIFKNMITSVRGMALDLFNGIWAYHRDVLYTVTLGSNFDFNRLGIDNKEHMYTTEALPNQDEAFRLLKDVCLKPNYHFRTTEGGNLKLISEGAASAYFEDGEKKLYLRVDRLVFNHSDKIGFVMD